MNAAEMKRAAGRALELGLTAVLTVPVVLVILAAAAAAVWLWASRMLPQPVYEPETFTQARWEELDDRGVLVDSLLEQYDGLEGMGLAEVQALLGEHPYTREDPEVGMYRDGYYIGAGRENSGREEVMVLQFRDGEVIRVEFEDAG